MLVEANLTRGFASDIDSLAAQTIETGKTQVMRFELVQHEEVESEDGYLKEKVYICTLFSCMFNQSDRKSCEHTH